MADLKIFDSIGGDQANFSVSQTTKFKVQMVVGWNLGSSLSIEKVQQKPFGSIAGTFTKGFVALDPPVSFNEKTAQQTITLAPGDYRWVSDRANVAQIIMDPN